MSYKKFSSAEELLKGYLNLESAFTKKCQYISLLKEIIEEKGLALPAVPQREGLERADFDIKVDNEESREGKKGAKQPDGQNQGEEIDAAVSAIFTTKGNFGKSGEKDAALKSQKGQAPLENTATKTAAAEIQAQGVAADKLIRINEADDKQDDVILKGCVTPQSGGCGKEIFAVDTASQKAEEKSGSHYNSFEKIIDKISAREDRGEADANNLVIEVEDAPSQKCKEDLTEAGKNAEGFAAQNNSFEKIIESTKASIEEEEGTKKQKALAQGGGISAKTPPPTEEELLAKYPLARLLNIKAPQGESGFPCFVTPFEKALLDAVKDAEALYQALANDEQYIAGFLDSNRKLAERVLNNYALACARSTPPVIGKGSVYPSAPPQKPKTLEEAKGLIRHYIK